MNSTNGALILKILRGGAPEATAAKLDGLMNLAAAHGLVGHIYEAQAKRHPPEAIPEWQAFFDEQAVNSRVRMQVAAEVASALREAKIACAYAKGVAFNATVYETPGVRPFSDLDLLVTPETLRQTHEVLTRLGFAPMGDRSNPIEVSYTRERLPGFPVSIDLHWEFAAADSLQAAERIPVVEILSRARVVNEVPVPAHEDSLLLAASNLIRKSAEPVMLLVDFQRLSRAELDWSEVVLRARAWGLGTGVWLGLTLANELFDAEVPKAVKSLAPAGWRQRWLLTQCRGERLWQSDKQQTFRYRVVFKLMCLNSVGELLRVVWALPRGVARKLGLSKSLAEDLPR